MVKTKVVLFFGAHRKYGEAAVPDKEFFRREVGGFFKEWKGRKATVIHEEVIAPLSVVESFSADEPERVVLEIEKAQESKMPEVQKRLDRLNAGRCSEADIQGDGFGFLEIIAGINAERPNAIWNYIEPQHPAAAYEWFYADWGETELKKAAICALLNDREAALEADMALLEMACKIIVLRASSIVKRDAEVVTLARWLRGVDPSRAIVITRGAGHMGLHSLFNSELFEVEEIRSGISSEILTKFRADDIAAATGLCDRTFRPEDMVEAANDFLMELKADALEGMEKIRKENPEEYAKWVEAPIQKED